ncbi:HU family DNA-binding protein [Parabacteroides bouchesdurhonensis]|uniref:HU family DNA-binding protein n=1 Tax=Parabacteroides bouchesdurhonensis TaxID=1936995 RepID=UPI001F19C8FD|nr:HU family DNA-binding protein [Parabacteroides bouchesdurhonensis]
MEFPLFRLLYICIVFNSGHINLLNFIIMSQGFKLVQRSSKPGEQDAEKKYYAMAKSNGTSSLKHLCKLIAARSTVSSADVKAVLDNLNFVMDLELQEGRIVQLGEFGNFRLSVSSDGVTDQKDFDNSLLRKPKIVFTPGSELRETKKTTEFTKVTPEVVECNRPHAV